MTVRKRVVGQAGFRGMFLQETVICYEPVRGPHDENLTYKKFQVFTKSKRVVGILNINYLAYLIL